MNSSVKDQHPNHIYIGPDAFAFDLDTHVKYVKIHGVRYFLGPLLRYEYLKPNAFYAGVDFLASWGNKKFKLTSDRYKFEGKGGIGFANLELRLGYSCTTKNGTISPYLGMGAYGFGNTASKELIGYFATGMRSLFAVNPSFSMGLNLKVFCAPDAERRFKFRLDGHEKRLREQETIWGGEIGIPLAWYLGASKRWEIQLEPYFLKLDFSSVQNIYGTRLLFGYRF